MVAYLLPPDLPIAGEQVERPRYDYKSIGNRVQAVLPRSIAPDADAWRVARNIVDGGPKVEGAGKVDVRECVNRIARGEPVEPLPRGKVRRGARRLELLTDLRLTGGVFSSDVDEFSRALRATAAGTDFHARGLIQRDGTWLAGDGPIWTFEPLEPAKTPVWYVIIAGGAAVPGSLETWNPLIALLGQKHAVSMVWVGDGVTERRSPRPQGFTTFRAH